MRDYQLVSQDTQAREFTIAKAIDQMSSIPIPGVREGNPGIREFLLATAYSGTRMERPENRKILEQLDRAAQPINAVAKAFRSNTRKMRQFPTLSDLSKSGAISKADLDVGTLTNFAQITGGQSLGYVSLDTQMARGTVRPNSFTLYQCLRKTGAFQVVDYWPYAFDTGGGLPGTAFTSYGSVASGTLNTSAGQYELQNITLKLAVNGRAITTALAAQNSFVDVTAQENINAALTVLESVNFASYYGNPSIFPNQFTGIANAVPTGNIFDWYQFSKNPIVSGNGWSNSQTLFNLIYEASAQITSYRNFGRITHAFMSPVAAGSLQSLVTTLLNNIQNIITPTQERLQGIVVDGDLQGMRTRFGEIQFPIDLYIGSRDKPAQAITFENGSNAVTSTINAPTSLVANVVTGAAVTGVSYWDATFVASSGVYSYATSALDASMNESALTILSTVSGNGASGIAALSVSGIAVGGAVTLTVTPNGSAQQAVRLYRSGLGYTPSSSGAANPAAYRLIGTVLCSGAGAATFQDTNSVLPGGETVFLLDMDENDYAIDYRYLLPLTKIDLFAANLFMPWAVAAIGSIRLRIPKFHGYCKNYLPDNPDFSPLLPNTNAI